MLNEAKYEELLKTIETNQEQSKLNQNKAEQSQGLMKDIELSRKFCILTDPEIAPPQPLRQAKSQFLNTYVLEKLISPTLLSDLTELI